MSNFLLKCPVCNKKMWFKGASAHRKMKHPSLSNKEFETLIIKGINVGNIKPKIFEKPDNNLVTATTKLAHERKYNKVGIRSIVSGGKTK